MAASGGADTVDQDDNDGTLPAENVIDRRTEQKCRGVHSVKFTNLKEPPAKFSIREIDDDFVSKLKETIETNGHINATVLPVVVQGKFDSSDPCRSTFYTLGGNHLREAQTIVNSEQEVQVKVYEELSLVEATRVAFLHNEANHNSHAETFKDKVAICRRLLYHVNDVEDTEEPPPTDVTWKYACAIALGMKCSGEAKAIDLQTKKISTILQVARYSKDCWEAVCQVFDNYVAETKKHLAQTVFQKLQGIAEEDKLDLLIQCAQGDVSVEEMGNEAVIHKRKKMVEQHVLNHFKASCSTMEEVYEKHKDKVSEGQLEEFVQAKDGKRYVHAFTQKTVSPGFADFLTGMPTGTGDIAQGEWETHTTWGKQAVYSENCNSPTTCKGATVVFYELGKVPTSKLNEAYSKLKKREDVVFMAATTNNVFKYQQVIEKMTSEGDYVAEIDCGGRVAEIALRSGRNVYIIGKKSTWDAIKVKLT